jgi:prolipoprotein diacylglyceryl transferase
MLRASIPSPPESWQVINLGQVLRDLGADWATFNLSIHAYALCILLGIFVGLIITNRRLVARGAEPWVVLDIALLAIPFGIIGGRAYHVLTHPADYFAGQDILRVFYIWEGGMAIFGALILGAVGAYIGARLVGIRFWAFADAIAPGLLVAQAFGRIGTWFNRELFGTPTDLPWGLEIESTNPAFPIGLAEGTLFHPTFLYEAVWNVIGALVIVWLARRVTLQWGKQFGLYLIWYGIGRIATETIRLDPSETIFGVRVNVWGAVVAVLLGVLIIVVQSRRHTGLEASVYQSGREWVPQSEKDATATFTKEELEKKPSTTRKKKTAPRS